jgi:hypothetical protein
MPGGERAQSEVVGTVLLSAIVVISMSVIGTGILINQSQQTDRLDQPSTFETGLNQSALTITHYGGTDHSLAELVLVIRQGDTEESYNFSDITNQADLDDDGVFAGGESVTVSHSYTGEVRILLIDTSAGGSILYDATETVSGSTVRVKPTIERFDITDTSSGGHASFNVTWSASDKQGDISAVTVELINDGTVVDNDSISFPNVTTTEVGTSVLINDSGGGEVYQIKLTVTDSAGNTVTASKGDTADSDIGIRPPTIERFETTDVSTGSGVKYEYSYNASDPDGDLGTITLELFKESTGVRVDSVTDNYTRVGTTDIQTGTLADPTVKANENEKYRIDILVTDFDGNDVLATVTDTADGDGTASGTGSPPSIGRLDVTDTSSGKNAEFDVTWNGSDVDGNLQNATLELWSTGGQGDKSRIVDSVTYSSGDFTSGSDTGTQTGTLRETQGNNAGKEYVIRIVVTDDEGKTGDQEESNKADGNDTT